MIRPRAQRGKCWIWNSQAYSNVFFENRQFAPKSGLGTLMFRYDTGRHIWSGCISLHQAPRISCPLDLVVRICLCGECFSLLQSTQLEGDRAARGHSLWIEKRKEDRMNNVSRFALINVIEFSSVAPPICGPFWISVGRRQLAIAE